MNLLKPGIFAKYMEGCAMELKPSVVFDLIANNDQEEYVDYSSYFGSFYCGGNRGSMTWPGTNTIEFNRKVIIFDKFVGGCNGNLKAIGKLVEEKDAEEIAAMLKGNDCGGRGTSCADQLSKALTEALAANK